MTAIKPRAPWSDEQVEALNDYQQAGWMHPFTCGRCRDADTRWPSPDQHLLVATNDGWTCPACDYTQDWAHDFMFHGPPEALRALLGSGGDGADR